MVLRTYSLSFLIALLLFLSLLIIFINEVLYQFPANNFFPQHMLVLTSSLILINWGLILLFGRHTAPSEAGMEFFRLFAVMSLIVLATNAVQLTPFPPIDQKILALEEYYHIHIPSILAWSYAHPYFKNCLGFVYDSLPYQMSLLPLIPIAAGKRALMKEYYFLLLFSTLLGFGFYYFFPTTAPASIIKSPYFFSEQLATGLKFYQIHHHISPTTNEGGLIALPSFHTVWALLNVYLLKEWPIARNLLLMVNTLLIAACVLLGWHYLIDVVAAFFVVAVSYYLLTLCKPTAHGIAHRTSAKRGKSCAEDHPCIQ